MCGNFLYDKNKLKSEMEDFTFHQKLNVIFFTVSHQTELILMQMMIQQMISYFERIGR